MYCEVACEPDIAPYDCGPGTPEGKSTQLYLTQILKESYNLA